MTKMKEIFDSHWLRVINFLLLILIGLISYSFETAKNSMEEDIKSQLRRLESVERKVQNTEVDIATVKTGVEYIKEKIDDVATDLKELKK